MKRIKGGREMAGKVVVITGANSGLGLETAKYFVRTGYVVVMAVRDVNKGEFAKKELQRFYPEGNIEVR